MMVVFLFVGFLAMSILATVMILAACIVSRSHPQRLDLGRQAPLRYVVPNTDTQLRIPRLLPNSLQ